MRGGGVGMIILAFVFLSQRLSRAVLLLRWCVVQPSTVHNMLETTLYINSLGFPKPRPSWYLWLVSLAAGGRQGYSGYSRVVLSLF